MLGKPPTLPGDPPQAIGNPRGVVLSEGSFLGLREIQAMRRVPELVFVNCCHLAAVDASRLLAGRSLKDPSGFAASVAQALIGLGVRCVVAAGWAVDDQPAARFAEVFYEQLLQGHAFIDAVAAAREAARDEGGHTWAAYQCYGDPNWVLRSSRSQRQRREQPLAERFSGIASPVALAIALETLVVECRHQGLSPEQALVRVRYLEQQFETRWGAMGAIAEALALAFDAAGDRCKALGWYRRALAANDGSASLRAAEQLGNLMARQAWSRVAQPPAAAPAAARVRGRGTKPPPVEDQAVLAEARRELGEALQHLERVAALQPTSERLSLLGSACKRSALLARRAGDEPGYHVALRQMTAYYQQAEDLARESTPADLAYPALNRLAGELVSVALEPAWAGFAAEPLLQVSGCLKAREQHDPDFWSVVGQAELALYEALAGCRLAAERHRIEGAWADLKRRMPATSNWQSVRDQVDFVLPAYEQRVGSAALVPALSAEQRAAELRAARALQATAQRLCGPV